MDGTHYSDEELVRRISKGDADGLKLLFVRYYPALCGFSASIVKSTQTAEETVADVFAELWLKRTTTIIRSSPRQYLYTAVRNRSLNALRSVSGLHTHPIDTGEEEFTSPEFDADRELQFNELEETIDGLIDRMPERRRLIFRMSRIDGLSYQEIADILSISVYTVQNQIVGAVKFLCRFSNRWM
jgi:RNA polymerase sigma-70 factor, ECF subfamily